MRDPLSFQSSQFYLISLTLFASTSLFSSLLVCFLSYAAKPNFHFHLHIFILYFIVAVYLSSYNYSLSLLIFSLSTLHHLVSSPAFQSVTSEMDWKTSSAISSTIFAPSCPPLTEPPDPSIPSFLRTCPLSTTQQSRPSPYAYSLPAFTRAHPPALPTIFQPSARSGISLPLCSVVSLGSDYCGQFVLSQAGHLI